MELDKIISLLKSKFGDEVIHEIDENASPKAVVVGVADIHRVCMELHTNEQTYFDMLSCLTGLDNGPDAGTMEVVYNLYSVPFEMGLMIKVKLDRNKPEINTVSDIWKTADWHEREAYDMFGIKFENHPDLRRILLPADWEGYPMQKDYQHQEYYRGIKVEY
ncbi:NADH-quinone oxidoreductase subunit C [Fulvivirga sp. 29W222]|uniref:NADH-quinone oxidoreductase subunit C n=1 Tax=Fulvivirga marina TaxID=2494733 RepID=A0A937FW79_9BACT|nr:NADH-quinone oxidoreductase subunit C [Fulvivirga marina]MBL6447129.1 NADH-quinone oxidoreductase subunit C [Fulvivirga marina]